MSGDECTGGNVNPDAIRGMKERLEGTMNPDLDRMAELPPMFAEIEHSNFTAVERTLAVAYWAAAEFIEQEIPTKQEHMNTIIVEGLEANATTWELCDDANTFPEAGGE